MSIDQIVFMICIIIAIIFLFGILCKVVFDDDDMDLYWHDNYAVIECEHPNQTEVVVWASATCEEIHTICDDCSALLKVRTDC